MKTKSALQLREITGCICVAALLTSAVQSAPLVADDFESGTGKWQPSGAWGLTTLRSASPGHSATDTPGAYYTNNNDSSLTLAAAFSLVSDYPRPAIAFKHAYDLEHGYDFGRVEISTDGGGIVVAHPACQLQRHTSRDEPRATRSRRPSPHKPR